MFVIPDALRKSSRSDKSVFYSGMGLEHVVAYGGVLPAWMPDRLARRGSASNAPTATTAASALSACSLVSLSAKGA
jgi:hypothetical protein